MGWPGSSWCPRVPYNSPTAAGGTGAVEQGADPSDLLQIGRIVYKPFQEGECGYWGAHVGLLACGVPQT